MKLFTNFAVESLKIPGLKFAGKLIKIVILILTFGFIYLELFHRRSFPELIPQFKARLESGSEIIWLVIAFMPVNWALETVKWKYLLKKFHNISFFRSFQAIMTGVSVSFFTPNRVGEFGGRILYLPPKKRIQGVTASIVGSISQLAVTIIFGLIGLITFTIINPGILLVPNVVLIPASFSLLVISLFVYFRSSKVFQWFEKRKLPKNLIRFFHSCASYSTKELGYALMWSSVRFVVFCSQMALVMYAVVEFTSAPSVLEMMYLVPLYFFAITLIPTIGVSEVGTRGLILAQIMYDKASEPDLILAGTLVWLINVILPALIGTFTVWRIKIALKK